MDSQQVEAAAAVATAVVTFVALVAAGIGAWMAYRQLGLFERQSLIAQADAYEGRRASVRPILSLEGARLLKSGDVRGPSLDLSVRNVGLGPALDISLDVFLVPVSDEYYRDATALQLDEFAWGEFDRMDDAEPDGYAARLALGAGITDYIGCETHADRESFFDVAHEQVFVIVRGTFSDAYGQTFSYPSGTDDPGDNFVRALATYDDDGEDESAEEDTAGSEEDIGGSDVAARST